MGDTLNTAARLLSASRELGSDIVASMTLLDRIVLPPWMARERVASIALRGKQHAVPLAGLRIA